MLEDFIVVQSAVSAFNNMALFGPVFVWLGLLMLPVFFIAYKMRDEILNKIGWNRNNITEYATMWTVSLTGAWVVLIGGDYQILRDNWSILPMMCAVILFLVSLFVSSHLRQHTVPELRWKWLLVLLGLFVVGLSDMHAWWGPLLQVGAVILGLALGRVAPAPMRSVAGTVLIVLSTVVAVLMQPEFFRFGQLGNLTVLHLFVLLLVGVLAMMVVATNNVRACGRIKRRFYVKFKWLMRVVCLLGAALFMLTEAVPVLLGTMAVVFMSVAMSVWHMNKISDGVSSNLFALMLIVFGVMTVMPVITIIGILLWRPETGRAVWQDVKHLL
ncbi:MAG: hypothetical protein UIH99_00535 [Alphaproteobacteria bacterium]|nr:hypothetical protein [Alphaproteobacteria bacterium]